MEIRYDSPDADIVVVGTDNFVQLALGALSVKLHPTAAEALHQKLGEILNLSALAHPTRFGRIVEVAP